MEEWRPIPEFDNYQVSNMGNIRGVFGKALRCATDKNGYKYFIAYKGSVDNKKVLKVHRCVALAFIPNPDNKPTVDHLNRDVADNREENLRWATMMEQNKNKRDLPNKTGQKYIRYLHNAYYCYYKNNNRRFNTLNEAIQYRDMVLAQNTTDGSQGNDNHIES